MKKEHKTYYDLETEVYCDSSWRTVGNGYSGKTNFNANFDMVEMMKRIDEEIRIKEIRDTRNEKIDSIMNA